MKSFPVSTTFILTVTFAVLPLSFVLPTAAVSLVYRSSHGEPCNRTSRCDTGAWLGCFNGVCDCIKQDEMVYEKRVKKCVSKSGERCAFALDEAADKNFIFEVTACVAHASCSPEGICSCGNKFYENENGTCTPAIGHQESCDSFSKKCSQYQGLQCIEGLCQCHKSTSIYSDTEVEGPQCVGLAEQQCINSLCTHNATCSASNECACAEPLYADKEGLCVPKIRILGNCTATSQCEQKPGQKLVCLNGKCNCDPTISMYTTAQGSYKYSDTNGFSYIEQLHSPNTKRYEMVQPKNEKFHSFEGESRTQCVGLVDSPCLDSRCTSNSFCAYSIYPAARGYGYAGICKCQNNFTPSKRGTCATGYETACSTTSTCIDDLVCRSTKCRCPYVTQSFNASTKSCISQVGGPCIDNSSCGGNAECTSLNGVGHCTCKSGFVENASGKCKAAHDTECSSSAECDTLASLECVDQKCKCTTFSEYSWKLRKCVGLSGAKCNLKSLNPERECTRNSECKEAPHPLIPGTCTCSPGFIETSNYTCEVKAGVGNSEDL